MYIFTHTTTSGHTVSSSQCTTHNMVRVGMRYPHHRQQQQGFDVSTTAVQMPPHGGSNGDDRVLCDGHQRLPHSTLLHKGRGGGKKKVCAELNMRAVRNEAHK